MRRSAALALAGALATLPAAAQNAASPQPPAGSVGSTVSGAPPGTAASTTAVGRTKPPGTAAPGTRPDLEERSRQLTQRIKRGICTGC